MLSPPPMMDCSHDLVFDMAGSTVSHDNPNQNPNPDPDPDPSPNPNPDPSPNPNPNPNPDPYPDPDPDPDPDPNPKPNPDPNPDPNPNQVSHNNLGGVGPDSGAENIRYAGVGSLNGRAFDLLVE
eukprot:scaffold101311_cov36-Phaeocystis_antarctica.AAC.1